MHDSYKIERLVGFLMNSFDKFRAHSVTIAVRKTFFEWFLCPIHKDALKSLSRCKT